MKNYWTIIIMSFLTALPHELSAQEKSGTIDIFVGADLNYRDIYFNNRVYDVLVNLTPGVKWNMGHSWEAADRKSVV